jgi:hypothetical protein
MSGLKATLFGKLNIKQSTLAITGWEACKAQDRLDEDQREIYWLQVDSIGCPFNKLDGGFFI